MLSELSTGELQLRQKPGPKNTLGLVKFVFPNAYGVYMHDTSARSLFDRARRDLSHGCIRVEKPEELAEWVLSKQPGWSRERIVAAMRGTESVSVKIERPIQVVTTYSTAVVMENGEVHFFQDIYGEDAALEKDLARDPHGMCRSWQGHMTEPLSVVSLRWAHRVELWRLGRLAVAIIVTFGVVAASDQTRTSEGRIRQRRPTRDAPFICRTARAAIGPISREATKRPNSRGRTSFERGAPAPRATCSP